MKSMLYWSSRCSILGEIEQYLIEQMDKSRATRFFNSASNASRIRVFLQRLEIIVNKLEVRPQITSPNVFNFNTFCRIWKMLPSLSPLHWGTFRTILDPFFLQVLHPTELIISMPMIIFLLFKVISRLPRCLLPREKYQRHSQIQLWYYPSLMGTHH